MKFSPFTVFSVDLSFPVCKLELVISNFLYLFRGLRKIMPSIKLVISNPTNRKVKTIIIFLVNVIQTQVLCSNYHQLSFFFPYSVYFLKAASPVFITPCFKFQAQTHFQLRIPSCLKGLVQHEHFQC